MNATTAVIYGQPQGYLKPSVFRLEELRRDLAEDIRENMRGGQRTGAVTLGATAYRWERRDVPAGYEPRWNDGSPDEFLGWAESGHSCVSIPAVRTEESR